MWNFLSSDLIFFSSFANDEIGRMNEAVKFSSRKSQRREERIDSNRYICAYICTKFAQWLQLRIMETVTCSLFTVAIAIIIISIQISHLTFNITLFKVCFCFFRLWACALVFPHCSVVAIVFILWGHFLSVVFFLSSCAFPDHFYFHIFSALSNGNNRHSQNKRSVCVCASVFCVLQTHVGMRCIVKSSTAQWQQKQFMCGYETKWERKIIITKNKNDKWTVSNAQIRIETRVSAKSDVCVCVSIVFIRRFT